jgi:AraC family transcriptional activator of pobA
MMGEFGAGIAIGKASFKDLRLLEELEHSHRDDYHLFFMQEKGTTFIEIDFQKHKINPSSVIYVHPDQVHRIIAFENVTVSGLVINNETLNPEYLTLLEDITPAKPLSLKKETFSIISEAVLLCIKLSVRKHEKLYHSLLKDSCNMLVALIASQYLEQSKSTDTLSRFEIITKAFRAILETNFTTAKKPAEYAQTLNISIPYLNECIKNTTGHPVSYHIQQRVILEAKRLLYHSDKSVKEIASELGYDDYPYFSRLFTKVTGMTAVTFRNRNLE